MGEIYMYSICNVKNIVFSVYYISFGFKTYFFQILDNAYNTQSDITTACYFHT